MSKQDISELSNKTKESYLLKRMNNYMTDKIDPKKKPNAKKHINKTFKGLYGSPKPAGRVKPYMKNESIYHRLARLVLEDIVSEGRGYAGKGPGGQNWSGLYRRRKSGESGRKSSVLDGGTSVTGGPVGRGVTKGTLQMGVSDQNATGKGSKAKRRAAKLKGK